MSIISSVTSSVSREVPGTPSASNHSAGGSALASEGAGWLVRYGGAAFAWTKIAGFLLLQASLAALVGIALWSVFAGNQARNYTNAGDDELDDDWD